MLTVDIDLHAINGSRMCRKLQRTTLLSTTQLETRDMMFERRVGRHTPKEGTNLKAKRGSIEWEARAASTGRDDGCGSV